MEILHIENLSFTYPNSEKKALDEVNLSINSGEFVVVCGESGCGKTTLLKMLKKELTPFGKRSGKIYYNGILQEELDARTSAGDIGYVLQNPESQIVTDKVWHELAFGLENMGISTDKIRCRVGEMASYFGIGEWYHKKTNELSGGQKQLLNLASVMVMSPKILILDEPTSQLDPIAAADFIATLQKLNRELGLTVILVEHRLEDVFPIADKVAAMENSKILCFDTPRVVCDKLKNHKLMAGMPSAVRIWSGLSVKSQCPLTVKEGREFLSEHFENVISEKENSAYTHSENTAVECKGVWFRYERDLPDVLSDLNFSVYDNEIFCVLGGNGAGKTTMLRTVSGLEKPYRGTVKINSKKLKEYSGNSLYRHCVALLPQNPQSVFLKSTVAEDFTEICRVMEYSKEDFKIEIDKVSQKLGITDLLERHPYDLSGGEQQKCALAKMLLLKPKILLLDEPTKGIDAYSKLTLSKILSELKADGLTVIIVTHDVEFAAVNADRCALFFDGEIVSCDTPTRFFSDNNFYTTAASRISRHLYNDTVTCEAVISMCRRSENQRN